MKRHHIYNSATLSTNSNGVVFFIYEYVNKITRIDVKMCTLELRKVCIYTKYGRLEIWKIGNMEDWPRLRNESR